MEQDAKRMLLEYNRETKRLDDLYRCAAKQCGISECAFWILYTLRAEERQFTQAEICEFLIEPKQTVHSALKKLEAEGYLARTSGADLRSKRVALTEKGEQFARASTMRMIPSCMRKRQCLYSSATPGGAASRSNTTARRAISGCLPTAVPTASRTPARATGM